MNWTLMSDRLRNLSLADNADSEHQRVVDVSPLFELSDALLCHIVRLSENAQGCAATHSRLMSAVLRSKRAATVTAADGVPPDTICSSRCFSTANSFGDSAKLTLHVLRDNPRFCKRWFKDWALRLRPAKDMHALHIEFWDEGSRTIDRADTNKHMSPSMMDMLQWVLHGVENAVQVITISQTYPPMFHFNTQSSYSRMGAEAGLFFSQLTHLRSLRLHGALVEIQTMACPHLRQCLISLPQLHDLVLSNNGLDAKDLETLEPAWNHLPALQSLDLGGNELFCNAACSLAIALRSLTTLTFLSLSKNYLFYDYEDELSDFQMLSSALSGLSLLRTLDMSFLKIFAPFGCAAFSTALNNLTALSHLNLNYVHLDFNSSVHSFPGFLSGPSGLQHLSMAYFSSDEINAEGFAFTLRTLTGLRYLDLSNSSRLCALFESQHFFSSLQALTRLEVLNLSAVKIQCEHANLLVSNFYPALEGMQFSLRSLDVSGHPLLEWNSATEFSNALTCLKHTLQHLTLMACLQNLPLECIVMIATALSGLERLQSIDLSDNSISASSMGVLGPSLGCLTTLKSLNLSSNRDLLSEDGASHISAALIKLTGLTYLGMRDVSGLSLVGVQQLRVLTPSLAALTKLESLNLMRSAFLAEEIALSVLAPALRQLSTLTQLIVGGYKMNPMGSAAGLVIDESSVIRAVLSEAISHMPACKLG
ncbi:hypothetical protein CEUSTIGMA_g6760.t1 [Chlamydomonas eustigma]|uniref:F-box domain-containing protein n=1 Tax=Chlamydomonas eustigma TaxID=1157962 RepID=A0A250X8S5_9CHLO|nr:hypothetical protein CEUSTIGMA_g6760.t1 [Chlamydomonas eustigma]|eukprot:GAX79319.1 hypothetical protein CEUSTIGMA_g6760.t1 [Chlamydomonas eustigma]